MKITTPLIAALFLIPGITLYSQTLTVDDILADGAEMVKIKSGFRFTEGPAVHPDGRVFFTDQPNNKIYIWDESDEITEFEVEGERANGMWITKDGKLITCSDLHNRLLKIDMEGNKTILAEEYKGKHLNGPNDVWVNPEGYIYFSDSYYQRPWWEEGHTQLQDQRAVYCVKDNGKLIRVAEGFQMPNGLIGTPDGKYLYVADINAKETWRYDIESNGKLSNKTFFAKEGSDGMTIDNLGNVYFTTGPVVLIIDPDGNKVGEIPVPENPANVVFGGKDRDILFITARTSVYRIDTKVRGAY
ncbi:MAG: SMP-30/gluconolactonase/LRE family protein [Bacteroidales bacterium]